MSDTPRPDVPPSFGAHEPYPAPPIARAPRERRRHVAAGRAALGAVHHSIVRRAGDHRDAGRRRVDRRHVAGASDDDAAGGSDRGLETCERRAVAAGERAGRLVAERAVRGISPGRQGGQPAGGDSRSGSGRGRRRQEDGPGVRHAALLPRAALGEFEVDAGTESLLDAAKTNRDPQEALVRRGAAGDCGAGL